MHISLRFHFDNEEQASAVIGVQGDADFIMPGIGDSVSHYDANGKRFQGIVKHRHFSYELTAKSNVERSLIVTLSLTHAAFDS